MASFLRNFDAFPKTDDEFRKRTSAGAVGAPPVPPPIAVHARAPLSSVWGVEPRCTGGSPWRGRAADGVRHDVLASSYALPLAEIRRACSARPAVTAPFAVTIMASVVIMALFTSELSSYLQVRSGCQWRQDVLPCALRSPRVPVALPRPCPRPPFPRRPLAEPCPVDAHCRELAPTHTAQVHKQSDMYVDTSLGERLTINFDFTFPAFPCAGTVRP